MVSHPDTGPREGKAMWRTALRKWLRRRGLALLWLDATPPPTLPEALRAIAAGGVCCCLDSELATQTDLLAVFPAGQVTFVPDLAGWRRQRPAAGWRTLVVDPESVDLAELLADEHARVGLENIIVCASLGYFWMGDGDLIGMTRAFHAAGFGLHDVFGKTCLLSASAPSEPVTLVYRNEPCAHARTAAADARVSEALAVFSPPMVRSENLRRLAGRGSFGFASGVLNPGAMRDGEGNTILLARGERFPWTTQKRDETVFVNSARPVLMELAAGGDAVTGTRKVTLDGDEVNGWRGARVEDFRLFRFGGEILSNCAVVSVAGRDPQKGQAIQTASLTTKVGLARFDPASARLTCLGTPRLDRPTRAVEKNWAMFEADGALHLLYSFNPYHLLRATNWPSLEFTTVRECNPPLPPGVLPAALRNSVNPVPYDDQHFLHVVHAVFPVKRYAFWAVLIDRATLLPTRVSSRPLVCGWRSAPASLVYVTAILAGADLIEIYGGLNDCSVGRWTLRRDLLDAAWLPLA